MKNHHYLFLQSPSNPSFHPFGHPSSAVACRKVGRFRGSSGTSSLSAAVGDLICTWPEQDSVFLDGSLARCGLFEVKQQHVALKTNIMNIQLFNCCMLNHQAQT